MKLEDQNDAVQGWSDAALRLGRHGFAELKRESARGDTEREMLAPTIEWMETNLGG